MFETEMKPHFTGKLLPFWRNMQDQEYGGFYGYMGYDLKTDKKAVKGCILNSRILWTFSNAYRMFREKSYLAAAEHAWEFLKNHCVDRENGGVYWSVSFDGKPGDTTKHTYNQAFAIYALASYYDASKDVEALALAEELYDIIENRCRDDGGYLEAFDRFFCPAENDKLSENGVMAGRTMNTLLHVFEAYTELYRVTKKEAVANNLMEMLELFAAKVYNPKLGRLEVFFDNNWNPLIDLNSYGHDIEASWLIDRGLEILGDEELTLRIGQITKQLAANIYERAYRKHSVANECERGVVNEKRIWWVQAESVVGFYNAYEKTGERKYLEASQDIWQFIKKYLIDTRPGGEWFWYTDVDGLPAREPIVEPWKCPYHNGRMYMEIMSREEGKI